MRSWSDNQYLSKITHVNEPSFYGKRRKKTINTQTKINHVEETHSGFEVELERKALVDALVGCKPRKSETEFDAIKRTFIQNLDKIKKLIFFKNDVTGKVIELLPEEKQQDMTQDNNMDVIKTLSQIKLELTRLQLV